MSQPRVIFLDAVGTLFGVRGSVGQIYTDMARAAGVETDVETLNQAFIQAFSSASPMAFPKAETTAVPYQEYRWWYAIAEQAFAQSKTLAAFDDFDGFFADLYAHFATAKPWFVYPETLQTLVSWQAQGIDLGVISNFDSRLYAVLQALDLSVYFKTVTISTEAGAAKPDPLIFATALQKHGCQAAEAWHIGDSYEQDYEGARAAGLKGILLQRPESELNQ
ncbi:MAG: HAD-IA family hydrolase [Leptolyngbyaceae cyanobacterium SM1_1_3]|nr:HAD-IA family hydrolase [Leptolyngbyaceae cyanobacterium SM1_1_3]NJN04731.1 HAD-IA family hydrolase [Leptolyngbyaceae cyanobacterium RM1_1_2]NJO10922.1 HAD-IA family hydrolase [Leptolyngbyaceae cyanobacterium SL_1_1]